MALRISLLIIIISVTVVPRLESKKVTSFTIDNYIIEIIDNESGYLYVTSKNKDDELQLRYGELLSIKQKGKFVLLERKFTKVLHDETIIMFTIITIHNKEVKIVLDIPSQVKFHVTELWGDDIDSPEDYEDYKNYTFKADLDKIEQGVLTIHESIDFRSYFYPDDNKKREAITELIYSEKKGIFYTSKRYASSFIKGHTDEVIEINKYCEFIETLNKELIYFNNEWLEIHNGKLF